MEGHQKKRREEESRGERRASETRRRRSSRGRTRSSFEGVVTVRVRSSEERDERTKRAAGAVVEDEVELRGRLEREVQLCDEEEQRAFDGDSVVSTTPDPCATRQVAWNAKCIFRRRMHGRCPFDGDSVGGVRCSDAQS